MRDPINDTETEIAKNVQLLEFPDMYPKSRQAVKNLLMQFLWNVNQAAEALDRQSPVWSKPVNKNN